MSAVHLRSLGTALMLSALAIPLLGQRGTGELRLLVKDASGAPLGADVTLTSDAARVAQTLRTDTEGQALLSALPFGPYRLQVTHRGFAPYTGLIHVRSAVPVLHEIVLAVAPVDTGVVVTADATLMNAERTGSENHVGADLLRDRQSAAPGRSLIELVNMQPGWLLEANGILHPRGSEYDVQYVIDGVPLFDNRSPSFAQSLQVEEFQSLRVLTGGYPAEYGRKLGGVVEVVTDRSRTPGFSGKAVLQAGSFGARSGYGR
jgi:hypothetical protein